MNQRIEVIFEDGEGNEFGRGILAGQIGDHVFVHIEEPDENKDPTKPEDWRKR